MGTKDLKLLLADSIKSFFGSKNNGLFFKNPFTGDTAKWEFWIATPLINFNYWFDPMKNYKDEEVVKIIIDALQSLKKIDF